VKFCVGSSYGWRDRGYRGDYYCDGRRWDRDGRCVSWRCRKTHKQPKRLPASLCSKSVLSELYLVGMAAALCCCSAFARVAHYCAGCSVEKLQSGSRYYYGDRWYGPGDRGGFGIYIGKK